MPSSLVAEAVLPLSQKHLQLAVLNLAPVSLFYAAALVHQAHGRRWQVSAFLVHVTR